MSDIKLFRLTNGQAAELQGDASDLEKRVGWVERSVTHRMMPKTR